MPTDDELNRLLAVHLFKLDLSPVPHEEIIPGPRVTFLSARCNACGSAWARTVDIDGLCAATTRDRVRPWASSAQGMLDVIEKMRGVKSRESWMFALASGWKGWTAHFYKYGPDGMLPTGWSETEVFVGDPLVPLPRIVCLAALRALGVEVEP